MAVPGLANAVPGRAVHLRTTFTSRGSSTAVEHTVHVVAAYGRAAWILSPARYEAYRRGECPGYAPASVESNVRAAVRKRARSSILRTSRRTATIRIVRSRHLEHGLDVALANLVHPGARIVAVRGGKRPPDPLTRRALLAPVLEKAPVDHRSTHVGTRGARL